MARLKGFQRLTPVEEALKLFLDAIPFQRAKTETVPLQLALDRVTAKDIVAAEDLPWFDRSAVDGYAVRARDTFNASQFKPEVLRITENKQVANRQARQVWTGNPVPRGADAVAMLENTRKTRNEIEVWSSVTPGENVSKKGEDVRKGEIAIKAGTRVKPHHLGLAAALGITRVSVAKKPRVAILATGNELVDVTSKPGESQVFEVNRLVLSALCAISGAEPLDLGISSDDVEEISQRLREGLRNSDMILTSGGTSVGGSDLVPDAASRIGEPGVIVHGVAMRPAMPTALAVVSQKPIVILPGNPVAAMIGFEVFVKPVLSIMLGLKPAEFPPAIQARMTDSIPTTLGRKTFVRVHVSQKNGELLAEPISAKGSSLLSTMTKANGYVIVSEDREGVSEGERVSVHLFDVVEARDDVQKVDDTR